ncbi:uncharacterized protein A1O9_08976 [Exophiala aquamarina CBS 119918]|uniref:Uncharacterized protein n=1 Tax=Exophiala aquamarina CBS 119918 TaxID=1182545 RepID=A0A072P6J5_9EURO|nr:uncharacterized protein A1O9_08976 [Exophiala aquamarina CBS 119918]KEF55322.1 hypothetical protein A1O9_08976 [Exophiala aquamarina CBS 119918]
MATRYTLFHTAICSILAFNSVIRAQLLGCDAVGCPQVDGTTSSCPIANVTAEAIGTANITSAISLDPLTWTVAFSSNVSPTNSSVDNLERNLYLGTPASLDLARVEGVKGCALVFKDVVNRHEYAPSEAGTCQVLLGNSCAADLMSQANETLSDILASDDASFICSKLAVQLRDNAPSSCSLTDNGFWGAISVQDITGSSLAAPVMVDPTCNPTSHDGYKVQFVDSQRTTTVPFSAPVNSFAWGVTPVMSVFYSSTSTTKFKTPELHLSCLKPVAQDSIVVVQAESTATAVSSVRLSLIAISVSIMIALLSA